MSDIAVIGCGYWGPNLIRVLCTLPYQGNVYVCDTNSSRLQMIHNRYPMVKITTELSSIIENPEIDKVIIATPISTHYDLAKRALKANKHVFVEKPMTQNSLFAQELVKVSDESKRILMVGHTFEFSPPVTKIKQLIQNGDLGEIYFITTSRVNLGLHQRDVSVIWDLAPHDFSILFHILNEAPVSISAFGKDYIQKSIPDVAFINLEFPSKVIAHVQVSWLAPSKLRRTAIVGSKKMLIWEDTDPMEKVKIYDKGVDLPDPQSFGEFQLSYRTGDIVSPKIASTEPLQTEIQHFLECCKTQKTPLTDGRSGLRVVKALEMAEASLSNQGSKVYWE